MNGNLRSVQGSLGASYSTGNWFSIFFNSAAGQVTPRAGALLISICLSQRTKQGTNSTWDLLLIFSNAGKFTATAFRVIQKNAIALSGQTYLDPVTNIRRELYENRDQDQYGIEFEYSGIQLFNIFQPFANFTLMKSMMDEEGKMVINRENPVFITAAGFFINWKSFDFNLLGKYVSKFENDRFAVPTDGPQPLGDYGTIDITAGYTLKAGCR